MGAVTMINSPTFGRFVFDAVLHTDHSSNLIVTQHPVQTGASVADHSYMEPDEVQIEIGMSDAATNPFTSGTNRSVNAYKTLRAIMEKREPVTLITRLKSYPNMLITSISAPDDYTTMNGLKASVYFTQVITVSVSTVQVQQTVSASKTTTTNGSKKSTPSSKSTTKKPASSKTSTPAKKTSILKQAVNAAKTAVKQVTTKAIVKPSTLVRGKIVAMLK